MNKIITISGEPASGKSTVIRDIKEKLEEKGFKVKVISIGNIIREIANKEGKTISEFNAELTSRKEIDYQVDSMTAQRGKAFNENAQNDEILIIDSRLAWKTVPESFSIRLTCRPDISGKRSFYDKKRGKEDQYASIEDATKANDERKKGEVARYKMRYGVNLEDESNYNLVIDTSFSNVNDISNVIIQCFELDKKQQDYGRNWTSPKTLLPLQDIRETAFLFDEMKEIISKYGYLPDQTIEVIQVDGVKFIIEGHHRNFAVGLLGGTLVPYKIIGKDDEPMTIYGTTPARKRISGFESTNLYDYEETFSRPGSQFSYKEIYPEIYNPKFIEQLKRGHELDIADENDDKDM